MSMKIGEPCPCGNGKPVFSRDMCSICYRKDRRAHAKKCACGNPSVCRGLCGTCYRREMRESGIGIAADVKSPCPWENRVKKRVGIRKKGIMK